MTDSETRAKSEELLRMRELMSGALVQIDRHLKEPGHAGVERGHDPAHPQHAVR